MAFDTSNLPINGGLVLALALYTGASVLGGQVVGTRTIERSDWGATCVASIRSELVERRAPKTFIPKKNCDTTLGWLHPEINKLCLQLGNPDLNGPAAKAAEEAEAEARKQIEDQLNKMAAGAGSRCDCAARGYVQGHMIPLALYAGSGRLISLPSVTGLRGELVQSLNSSTCSNHVGSGQ